MLDLETLILAFMCSCCEKNTCSSQKMLKVWKSIKQEGQSSLYRNPHPRRLLFLLCFPSSLLALGVGADYPCNSAEVPFSPECWRERFLTCIYCKLEWCRFPLCPLLLHSVGRSKVEPLQGWVSTSPSLPSFPAPHKKDTSMGHCISYWFACLVDFVSVVYTWVCVHMHMYLFVCVCVCVNVEARSQNRVSHYCVSPYFLRLSLSEPRTPWLIGIVSQHATGLPLSLLSGFPVEASMPDFLPMLELQIQSFVLSQRVLHPLIDLPCPES